MSGGWWRPILLAGVVVAVILNAASRDEPLAKSASKISTPRPSPTDEPVAPDSAAPVPRVDDAGTVRLTGRDGLTVALTFDDGPSPTFTPPVLEILDDYAVRATFCLVGPAAAAHPELVAQTSAAGHALCNHTMTHDTELRLRSEEVITDEVDGTLEAIRAAAPEAEVKYFRAPGGYFSANVNEVAESYGLAPLGWSVDPKDWRRPGAAAITETVLSEMHADAIVLLHDGGGDRSQTVAALPEIIESLLDEGYEFVVPQT